MPVFQNYEPQVTPDIGQVQRVSTNGEAIGQGISNLGAGLQEAGMGLAHLQRRLDEIQKQKEAFNTANSTDTFKAQQAGQFQTDLQNAPADGTDFTLSTLQRYDQDAAKFLKTVPQDQLDRVRGELGTYRQTLENTASGKEHDLLNANSVKSLGDSYTSTLNAVNADPAQRDTLLKGLKQRIDMAPGLEAAQREDIYRNAVQGVAIQYVKSLAGADPGKVRQLQGKSSGSRGVPAQAHTQLSALDQKYDLPAGYLSRTMQIESGGRDVTNGIGAAGPFQFIPSTAARMGVDPHNFASASDGAARLAQESAGVLRSALGREPTGGELYLAHQQGAGGAAKLLSNPNAPAASIVGTKAVIQNGGSQGMTAGQFADMWINKYNDTKLLAYARAAVNSGAPPQSDATGSTTSQSAQTYTPTTDPVLSRLSPDQWDSLYNGARAQQSQNEAIARGNLEPRVQDATASLMTNGRYDGVMPTQQDFTAAYGTAEGAQRFAQFQQVQRVGKEIDAFKTMTPGQIQADVEAARPVGSGDGFAMQQSRYDAVQKAAATTLAMRKSDPAKYVQTVNPGVAAQWQNANTPDGYRVALGTMAAAQTQLGIAPQDQKLLPDDFAKAAIDQYKNDTLPFSQRIGRAVSAVLNTTDPDQQKAVFNQLVQAGLPIVTQGAIEAYARGDKGAGDRLMEAATVDPAKLPTDGTVKPKDIEGEVAKIMSPGQIGNMAYGLQNGDPNNTLRAQNGMDLLRRAARMRVAQGETDASKAVSDAAKDMFGDNYAYSQTIDGVNFSAAIPTGTNVGAIYRGVAAMKSQFAEAASRAATDFIQQQNLAKGNATTQAVFDATVRNQTNNILNNGEIVNYGRDGFAFLDTYTNKFIPGKDGKPLVFTLGDIQNADQSANPTLQAPAPSLPQLAPSPSAPTPVQPGKTSSIHMQPPPRTGNVPTSGSDAFNQAKDQFGTDMWSGGQF